MTAETAKGTLRFEAPSEEPWELDGTHFPRPVSRFLEEELPQPFMEGFEDAMRRYGTLIHHLEYRWINRFSYLTARPAPDAEVPERFATAAEVFARKLWRQDVDRWESEIKPRAIAAQLEIQAVDPAGLSDGELVAHIDRARLHLRDMVRQHHRHNGAALIPVGDFMAHSAQWTGRPVGELLALMRGAAPVSAGASDELSALVEAIRADSDAQALLESGAPAGAVLDQLLERPAPVGPAARAWIELVGYRLLDGLDVTEPYALENPDVLIRALRGRLVAGEEVRDPTHDELARIRALVPEEHRDQFDELLAEARYVYALRDERGIYSDVWAWGLLRRAVLEAGRRLAAQGRLTEAEHLTEAGFGEIEALFGGADTPSAADLAERARFRKAHSAADAPAWLGMPPQPPPPLDGLPPDAARVMAAIGIAIGALFETSQAPNEARLVRGIAASAGVYEGTARVLSGPAELDRLQEGDVLVAPSTTEAFNLALPLVGAMVTDSGGLLSHAAIVAREYGMPSVVGTREATAIIPDGARVRVDGIAGEVTVL